MIPEDLAVIETRVRAKYKTIVVDAFIVDGEKRILMQKRSANRKLFPNMWDPIGGHLESNETIFQCLKREMKEESQMELTEVLSLVHEFEWDYRSTVVLQFLCRAKGKPVREAGKASEIRWLSESEVQSLSDSMSLSILTGLRNAFACV